MIIEIKDLEKKFNKNTIALHNINLNIGKGIFGLLGKNGSGKTTLMRIITTLMKPTKGQVNILGLESKAKNYEDIKKNIGYLPQEFGFYKDFTVLEIMNYISILANIEKFSMESKIKKTLKSVGMYSARKKKYKELSGGMKRRVGLAQAMLNEPKILIVDEPTAGVDPEERIKIRNLLNEYSQDNTVLFSTHIVEDIENTCNKLAILNEGKLIFNGDLSNLLKLASGTLWECSFSDKNEFSTFKNNNNVLSYKHEEQGITAKVINEVSPLKNSKPVKISLEEAYVYITTKEAR
ncbi:ATP-binding cassette domain-containing protein [Clostridium botulinum]|uniref:ATP-binding cassette domain-containing protein n=1 Tax=Clostridium TaxID=1485 RepID=UPI000774920D|nr:MULTISPECIES: ATP-binding cassette domain-containing protein [Clostridium]MBN1058862.1 ATP-binding cassette domain-containing protein [Clostridium botulinum]MBN1062031.1 ATP-binding cassette domain-containing protein [Clostridium botulinum]MCS6133153.1 ATP-binding cassette domain-containing protein [Clostridium botulinum]NFG59856.1 ATP-binding cassette domain-containing protein [Clostridium botulinum]NFH81746.1 ATP-binding cassette domain-containing protein [Clostridium botulinum]